MDLRAVTAKAAYYKKQAELLRAEYAEKVAREAAEKEQLAEEKGEPAASEEPQA